MRGPAPIKLNTTQPYQHDMRCCRHYRAAPCPKEFLLWVRFRSTPRAHAARPRAGLATWAVAALMAAHGSAADPAYGRDLAGPAQNRHGACFLCFVECAPIGRRPAVGFRASVSQRGPVAGWCFELTAPCCSRAGRIPGIAIGISP